MTRDSSTFPWLLLQHLPGFGAGVLRRLLLCAINADAPLAWLNWPHARLQQLGLGATALAAVAEWQRAGLACTAAVAARRDRDWLAAHGAQLIHLLHPLYPPLLREIADAPVCLYVLGDATCLARPQLAVVGSRHPTRQGLADAEAFAATLAGSGFIVTSGLAYGIDAAAHCGALAAGGRTVAVLGTGIDVTYPARHRGLAEDIAGAGAVISELPLGSPPRAKHFPSRNRIISGLSLGVLVVEAAVQSGSLVTARLALEQNREVFALPGSIHNPASRGCNELLRNGATLVRDVHDIFNELRGWNPAAVPATAPATVSVATPALAPAAETVLAAIGYAPTPVDVIAAAVAQPLPALLAVLGELELLGLVENRAGTYQRSPG